MHFPAVQAQAMRCLCFVFVMKVVYRLFWSKQTTQIVLDSS